MTMRFVGLLLAALFLVDGARSVRLITWNLLAPMFVPFSAQDAKEGSLNPALLDQDVRTALHIYYLRKADADIMCLQEVEEDEYNRLVQEFNADFGSWFSPHGRKYELDLLEDNQVYTPHGIAMFYRRSSLTVKHHESFFTSQLKNTAGLAVFKWQLSPILLSVACIHAKYGVSADQIQMRKAQLANIVTKLEEIRLNFPVGMNIIAGDFNETPMFPGTITVLDKGYQNVFEATGSVQPPTYYDHKIMFNTNEFPLDYIYFKTYGEDVVQINSASIPDLSDEKMSFQSHAYTLEMLMGRILRYKSENILETNPSYLSYIAQILSIFRTIKPRFITKQKYDENLRSRAFRLGSDHVYVKSDFTLRR